MIIVTGGAGFIGSRLIKGLNDRGFTDIIVVDDMSNANKFKNMLDLTFESYVDKDKFLEMISNSNFTDNIDIIYHYGAESSTTCDDGKYLMSNNYQYTKTILDHCYINKTPLQVASSAAVYGSSNEFNDESDDYQPNNLYGYTKLLIDKRMRTMLSNKTFRTPMQALRFFNVISEGDFEQHKGNMKSPTAWMRDQINEVGEITLFDHSDNFKRDFIHIDAVVDMALDLMPPEIEGFSTQGIFNIGSGESKSFKDVADMMEHAEVGKDISINYVPMPEDIAKGYQPFTCADMSNYADRVEAGKIPPKCLTKEEKFDINPKVYDNSNAPQHILK